MFIRLALPVLFLFAAASAPVAGDDKTPAKADAGKASTFEHFKSLAGEWVGKGPDGSEMTVKYKVTSGGSAVIETITPGTDHEMVTMIHPDGDDVLLTHYCMLGNQPQMKAPGKMEGNKVDFKFTKATNLKSEKDFYMHDVKFTFVDKDTIKSEWTHFNDGKAAGTVVFELKRKK
ncbi:MAG TPA: hypothetical protein VG097_02310 [Gemmata sp.]|jgi:hypothetical protein|nr:hypothetical protein [Gemmata sp.]